MEEIHEIWESYGWKCPYCDTKNYIDSVPLKDIHSLDFNEEDQEDLQSVLNMSLESAIEDGFITEFPSETKCSKCERDFFIKYDDEQ